MQIYSLADILLPVYLGIIFFIGYFIKQKNIRKNPVYKYFLSGLMVKIFGGLAICLVYTFYYEGGDIINYHLSAKVMVNLLLESPENFFQIWFGDKTAEKYSFFNESTGFPVYWNDKNAYSVVNFSVPIELLSFTSFLCSAVLMASVAYCGIWKLYLIFCEMYPMLYKQFAVSILFIPSVIFWGSGILKDTWTLAAACWYCYSFYMIFIARKKTIGNIFPLIISMVIMVLVKPYVFVALMPGSILWGIWGSIIKIKNILIKIVLGPLIAGIGGGIGFGLWTLVSSDLGVYSNVDKMVAKAHITQMDMKRDYYQGNSFDIGDFEPTLGGAIKKFPQATIAGLFRPFLWESRNIVMIISGLENLVVLALTLFFLIRVPISFFKQVFTNPIVLFCILFSIIFAFAVGLSTSNFGSLVRLKIPIWPFYFSALLIINHHRIKYKLNRTPDLIVQN